jgi:glycosyltransferase involved in cell wall biosynthesis
MKLCLIARELAAGGAERVIATLANHWAESGWDITLVTFTGIDGDFYHLNPSIKRITLDLESQSQNLCLRLCKYIPGFGSIRRIVLLRRILYQSHPQVALAFMPVSNVICGLACLGTNTLAVGSEHNHPPIAPLTWHWKILCRLVYPRLSAVSALTNRSADWIRSRLGARNVPVIPNPVAWPLPVTKPELIPSEVLSVVSGSRLLLAVGRLEHQKGVDRLLAAFALLQALHPDWRLAILGEGSLRISLERQIDELGLRGRVLLPGVAGNIASWYEVANIYVLTSRYEGFGNTLAESLAYGVPAVAVDCETGPREILRHDVDGLLVPQGDQEALVGALDRLMGDESLRIRFSERAVEARERFSVGRVAGQWEVLFKELLNKQKHL